ncbi:hypothetical protein FACS1894142_3970 [Spirochaetia bacterium]|nr:hypothetical protein FACS1894142_3970 [Spirochaetia bacterium]
MGSIIGILFRIIGGLCLFLYGMKVLSDGIQQTAGDRMQRVLNFMTGNRFIAVLTGFVVTAIIQSSSATTVMVVSFVNAGLLTLTQSIGVIMGANIGTTVTAWIVSLVGFSLKLSELALPAVGIGFILHIVKWKHQALGEAILGFGLLFMGLDFLTRSMPNLGDSFNVISAVSNLGFVSSLIGAAAGLVMTLIIHSSSAATAIMLTMAFNGIVGYEMAAAMILGANIGTTVDAALASIGAKTAARRAALVHVLFNVIGTCWALPLIKPLLALVGLITPGTIVPGVIHDPMITTHLAMLHTVFNVVNTIVFLPFVSHFAALVTVLVKDKDDAALAQGEALIRLLFQSRSFDETSVALTYSAFSFHMPGLFFIALNRILAPAFYAQSDSKSPTMAGVISFVVNMALAALLVGPLRGAGVALALTIASAVNTALLLFFLKKNPHIAVGRALFSALVYTVKLALFSIAAVLPVLYLNPRLIALFAGRGRFITYGVPLIISALIFAVIGIGLLLITRDKQVRGIIRRVRR